jgi:putative acetyltransferase
VSGHYISVMPDVIGFDDPRGEDVRVLLAVHLAFANEHSPPEDVHALDIEGLLDPAISFYSCRRVGVLLGVGALKQLDATHAELKSMHTSEVARGQGIGRQMVEHLLGVARERCISRVSLETGTMAAFAPARRLYTQFGFAHCEPFGAYFVSPNSVCMTLLLTL